jgi:hypothetical protein
VLLIMQDCICRTAEAYAVAVDVAVDAFTISCMTAGAGCAVDLAPRCRTAGAACAVDLAPSCLGSLPALLLQTAHISHMATSVCLTAHTAC